MARREFRISSRVDVSDGVAASQAILTASRAPMRPSIEMREVILLVAIWPRFARAQEARLWLTVFLAAVLEINFVYFPVAGMNTGVSRR